MIDRIQPAEHFPNVEFEWADLRHLNQMYEADYLIHLAAVTNAGYAEKYPMETYETTLSEQDTLILSTDSAFFRFMKQSTPTKD